ncbi:MFS general substrate transporter [Dacryopinax primogenitus]|uniref:MFS general substrate transporter n=1 Tax=Dacryopinax primogenitus (strain DJM 731) TaxID=1858805 RepID=M5GD89_DACPD|nr:MFS general substrate transporter [Dacryopinax primogenitus]EJU04352.1 MFS general substrate transporter [Dacryopinax primogenitus]
MDKDLSSRLPRASVDSASKEGDENEKERLTRSRQADCTGKREATHGLSGSAGGLGLPSDPHSPTPEDCTLPSGAHSPTVQPGDAGAEEAALTPEEAQRCKDAARANGVPELQDQTNLLPFRQLLVVFTGLAIAIFVSLLDQTIVSTAIPQIANDFNSGQQAEWVGTSYLVTSTVFQPIYGRVSDIFGRKFVLLFTLAVFLIGSILCAIAQSMIQLIAFRAVTGIGGGGIITLVMIIVSDVVAMKDRGKYQGIIGGIVALGNSIGPVIGGTFTTKATWRWCFWLGVPLAGVAIVVVIFLLPLRRVKGDMKTKLKQVDYVGTVLSLMGTMGILLPLSWGGTSFPWNSAAVIAPLILGAFFIGCFVIVEWKFAKIPNIPLEIFRNKTVCGVQIATFLSGCAFYVQLYYLPQYFQVVKGVTSLQSGTQLLPLIVVQTVFSFSSGLIVSLSGKYRANIYLGFAIWSVGLGLLSTLSLHSTEAQQVGYLILTGVGAGQTFQTTLIAAQAAVPRNQMAVVTGTRNFVRMLGGTVALAVCQAILNNTVKTGLLNAGFAQDLVDTITSSPTTYTSLSLTPAQILIVQNTFSNGVQNVFRFCFPCAVVAFFVSALMIEQHSLKRGDEEQLKTKGKEWAAKHSHKKEGEHSMVSAEHPSEASTSTPVSPTVDTEKSQPTINENR